MQLLFINHNTFKGRHTKTPQKISFLENKIICKTIKVMQELVYSMFKVNSERHSSYRPALNSRGRLGASLGIVMYYGSFRALCRENLISRQIRKKNCQAIIITGQIVDINSVLNA